jgi:hypothetical protein
LESYLKKFGLFKNLKRHIEQASYCKTNYPKQPNPILSSTAVEDDFTTFAQDAAKLSTAVDHRCTAGGILLNNGCYAGNKI